MVSVVTVMLLAVRTERMSCMLLRLTNGEVAKAMPNPIKRRNTDPCNLHGQIAGFQCLRIPVDDANSPNTRVLNPDALPKPRTGPYGNVRRREASPILPETTELPNPTMPDIIPNSNIFSKASFTVRQRRSYTTASSLSLTWLPAGSLNILKR